jgi:hypothetical protein
MCGNLQKMFFIPLHISFEQKHNKGYFEQTKFLILTSRNAPVLGRRYNLCELIFYDVALRVDTAVICLIFEEKILIIFLF